MTTTLLLLVLLAPALGAAVLLLGGRRTNAWGPLAAIGVMGAATAGALALFGAMLTRPAAERPVGVLLYEWLAVGDLRVPFGLYLDQLSMSFVLLITIVGTLIHVYSLGYMAHDPDRRLFFGYLNLFVAAMLLLVLADNYLLLYVGWEGVGLASYLLIGFYRRRASAATAAKKAFLINRVGDFGLSVAIMVMFTMIGAVTFSAVDAGIVAMPGWVPLVLGLLLLLAAAGKSAQFPLQAWLFDAMEGPTPVSALIHAATMVTAGVYLIVRSAAIYDLSETARTAVIVVGGISILFGAIVGSARDDIKKALAGSTMSQIGYMVLAAGLGPIGYVFAIFHLLTHGFFKANLFLGAGSVMHGMNDEVNMRRYGGLAWVMRLTFITFLIGYLAIIGVPPFAGFYSKDSIIEAALAHSWTAGIVAWLGAGLTAMYMTRMVMMTFLTKRRWQPDAHPHESPPVMIIPMALLALGSAVLGYLLVMNDAFEHWLEPVTGFVHEDPPLAMSIVYGITFGVVGLGVLIGVLANLRPAAEAPTRVNPLVRAARADLYGDAINEGLFMRPGQVLTAATVITDRRIVDGAVMAVADLSTGAGDQLRRVENGFVRSYSLALVAGAVIVLAALLLLRIA